MRAFLSLALALLSVLPARSQSDVVDPKALAPIGLPSLLIGSPSAPAPVVAAALARQSAAVAALPVPAAASYLAAEAASEAPAERAAAKISAARLAASSGGRADARLARLAESARSDPALSAWFDGSSNEPSLQLEGLTLKRSGSSRRGATLRRIGEGHLGFVDVHPAIPGVVLKTLHYQPQLAVGHKPQNLRDIIDFEERAARRLAEIGAGPRVFSLASADQQLVSVRELILGESMEDLSANYGFTAQDSELVLELLRRLAAAGVKPLDLRASNIRIGPTLLDPRRRAYLVDSGGLTQFSSGLDEEARLRDLLDYEYPVAERMDPYAGHVVLYKSMRKSLIEGVVRSRRATPWQRFAGFWTDALGLASR